MPDKSLKRVLEFDATRGAAMFFVCLAHSSAYVDSSHDSFANWLISVGMIASPTFLLVSGIVSGYISTIAGGTDHVRRRFLDRGLFLLFVMHFVIGLPYTYWNGFAGLDASFYITDAVGVGLIVASLVAHRATPRGLAVAGVALLLSAWLIASSATPINPVERDIERLLFGLFEANIAGEGYIVPLVPYLGIFLLGLAAGIEYVRLCSARVTTKQLARVCIRVGIICMAIAVALKLIWLGMKPHISSHFRLVYEMTEPRQKIPPGVAYLLAYGGAGATMLGLAARIAASAHGGRLLGVFAVVGRASLFVFVVQYYVYYFPAHAMHLGVGHWAAIFPVSLLLLWSVAWLWDSFDGNRLFTVGVRYLGHRPTAASAKNG